MDKVSEQIGSSKKCCLNVFFAEMCWLSLQIEHLTLEISAKKLRCILSRNQKQGSEFFLGKWNL